MKYKQDYQDQANNEKLLKQSKADLEMYCQQLEKERLNEKAMRNKLEDEYHENSKNHETEVRLRMKFEQKLNVMHTDFRDLNTVHDRAIQDLNI